MKLYPLAWTSNRGPPTFFIQSEKISWKKNLMYYDKNLNDAEDFAVRKIKRICFRLIDFVWRIIGWKIMKNI